MLVTLDYEKPNFSLPYKEKALRYLKILITTYTFYIFIIFF